MGKNEQGDSKEDKVEGNDQGSGEKAKIEDTKVDAQIPEAKEATKIQIHLLKGN